MKFVSSLCFTFAASLTMSVNAEDSLPPSLSNQYSTAEFSGTGCLAFQEDDSAWIQIPDFESQGDFPARLGSPFQFSTGSSHKDQVVMIQPAGSIVSEDYKGWTLGVFDTSPQRDERLTPGRNFDIMNLHAPKHQAWFKNETGKFAVTWNSTIGDDTKHNVYQLVLSGAVGGDMGEGNNVCFCYSDMQWGPGKIKVSSSDPTNGHPPMNYSGGTYETATVDSLDHKTCCFHADKLQTLGSNEDFLSLCNNQVAKPAMEAGSSGDPHFKTWHNEHFEYHGQCDLVLTKDPNFANGLGIDVHIRTKLVRHWSYIKNAVIRIGNDILEIQGSDVDFDPKAHYWINFQYQGDLVEFAGFPVQMFSQKGTRVTKNRIEIDLGSLYPGQKIILSTFKEFVKVSFENASKESFGNTVGMLGDFESGKTLARDGVTVLNDFTELGHEWQVLPSDGYWFHEGVSHPQFPAKCIDPEDPRGVRRRRLDGLLVSQEQAQVACAGLENEFDRKDCAYDILATQDLDMAGAY